MSKDQRIPITILTGFLGSGKITMLNHWVHQPEMKDCAVLINEFGSVGLDHELVQQVDNSVVLLSSGCICCTLQSSFVNSLLDLFKKALRGEIPRFSRVVIETTGLADPGSLLSIICYDQFVAQRFRYDGTVTVIDASHIREQVKKQYESVKQIALADAVVISKEDLVDKEEIAAIREMCLRLNSAAPVYTALNGDLSADILKEIGPYRHGGIKDPKEISSWLRAESSDLGVATVPVREVKKAGPGLGLLKKAPISVHSDISTFSMKFDKPLDGIKLMDALDAVTMQFGDSLLRVKGIINLTNSDQPIVIHGVYGDIYPTATLDEWPEGKPSSTIVFIARETVAKQMEALFRDILLNDY